MNLDSSRTNPMTPLSQLHLSPLLSSSVTPPLRLYFLSRRLLLSCNCLNPDWHCPSVVMTTIWRTLSVADCCTDIFFTPLHVKPLCWLCCSRSMSLTQSASSLVFSHWCCTSARRAWACAARNQWLMSHEIILFHFRHLIIFFCHFFIESFFFFFFKENYSLALS